MKVDESVRRGRRIEEPDLYAEREVDVGGLWRRIAAHWWLPLAGLAIGLLVGYLSTVGGREVYEAKVPIRLGQNAGGGSGDSVATTFAIASEYVRAPSTVRAVAADVGMPRDVLAKSILIRNVDTLPQRLAGGVPLLVISVKGDSRPRVVAAANGLAARTIELLSVAINTRITTSEKRLATVARRLEQNEERIGRTTQLIGRLSETRNLGLAAFFELSRLNQALLVYETRRNEFENRQLTIETNLFLYREVEKSRVIVPDGAQASIETAQSPRRSLLVGGVIGLLLGAIAALFAGPFLARFDRRPAL